MYTAQGTLDKSKQIDQYIPLVRRLAHHLIAKLPASVQIDDLIQAGLIGLMDAITRFEEGQGAQFETYASQRIRGAMLDELRSADWMPRGVRQAQRKIETATLRAEQKLGRSASEKEIADVMGVSLDEYQDMLFDSRGASLVFYDDYADDGDGGQQLGGGLPPHLGEVEDLRRRHRHRQRLFPRQKAGNFPRRRQAGGLLHGAFIDVEAEPSTPGKRR